MRLFGIARRRFLALVAAAGAALLARRGRAASAPASLEPALAAFIDTLLPADDMSPAASELGIAKTMLAESAADELYTRLITVGCAFLDRAAEGKFAESNARVRDVIVTWMTEADYDEVPRRFYEVVRQRAVELYYSRTEGWGGLPIRRPPQPLGYPDHWK